MLEKRIRIPSRKEAAEGQAVKFDQDKIPYELLTFGAKKYGARNWEKGMHWSRPFGALMRHMWAWWRGEKFDAESSRPHLWHAACCLMFLIAYEGRNIGKDDR